LVFIALCNGDASGFEAIGKIILGIALFIGVGCIIVYAPWLILVAIVGIAFWIIISSKGNKGDNCNNTNYSSSNNYNSYQHQSEENKKPFIDNSIQTDFQRQLQENTKTPQQVEDENWLKEKEQITNEANRNYEFIKKQLLDKAKSGQYSIVENHKYISINFYCDYILKCVDRHYYYRPTEKVCYNINKIKQYNLYLNTITKFALEDNIKVIPFFAEVNIIKNSESRIDLPYTYMHKYGQSVATHKIKAYLECSIHY